VLASLRRVVEMKGYLKDFEVRSCHFGVRVWNYYVQLTVLGYNFGVCCIGEAF